jgi:hypothetical protein
MSYDVVVADISHKINSISTNIIDIEKDIPGRVFVLGE